VALHPPLDLPERLTTVEQDDGVVTLIGSATMLVRLGGFTLATDPGVVPLDEHAPSGYGLRSRRRPELPMTPDDLPPLDFLVLSHHHGDHVDEREAMLIDKQVPIITTPQASRKLRRRGFTRTRPLAAWDSQVVTRGRAWVRVTALPVQHGPRPLDRLLPPVMGSLLEFRRPDAAPRNLYLTGDLAVHDRLRAIAHRYPTIHATLLALGGTHIAGTLLTTDATQTVGTLRPGRAHGTLASA
jgi:L-ascorbate metabolism protein UlaG (beta-lactamase superfamily)